MLTHLWRGDYMSFTPVTLNLSSNGRSQSSRLQQKIALICGILVASKNHFYSPLLREWFMQVALTFSN
jgi:hypothetical protein